MAIVATGDTEHVAPALCALEQGYHLLLEKPIAPDPLDCIRVVEAAVRAGRLLQARLADTPACPLTRPSHVP